jgi:hypothetical protein
MLNLDVAPRVKDGGDVPGIPVDTGNVWAFVQITVNACKGEIRRIIAPAMLFSDDAFDVKCGHVVFLP